MHTIQKSDPVVSISIYKVTTEEGWFLRAIVPLKSGAFAIESVASNDPYESGFDSLIREFMPEITEGMVNNREDLSHDVIIRKSSEALKYNSLPTPNTK